MATRYAPRHLSAVNTPARGFGPPAGDGEAPRTPEPGRPTKATPVQAIFVVAFFVALVLPLALMPFAPADAEGAERRELAAAPRLVSDEGVNLAFLRDAGDYFADHFAFRANLVDLDATIRQRLFLTSATPNVVVGTQGWLYYAGELADYQRTGAMSDAALDNAAHNLALVQEALEAQGKRFALVVAPNKSTAVPGHMPYYLLRDEGASNLERLVSRLDERGVAYVDASAALASAATGSADSAGGFDDSTGDGSAESLYFARDSHWNDAGALVAYEAIVSKLGQAPLAFDASAPSIDKHLGDLDRMLHPTSAMPEHQEVPEGTNAFTWLGEATNVEDGYLATQSTRADATGTLLMYRDSFANNLVGPLASTYQAAVFTKRVPYNLGPDQVGFARDVVIERAERHLGSFATTPPYMPAPKRTFAAAEKTAPDAAADAAPDASPDAASDPAPDASPHAASDATPEAAAVTPAGALAVSAEPLSTNTTLFAQRQDPYLMVEGTLDEAAAALGVHVYVELTLANGSTHAFECFRASEPTSETDDFEGQAAQPREAFPHVVGDAGYRGFVFTEANPALATPLHARILVGSATEAREVASLDL